VRPYYQQDRITIYHGDCRELLPSLQADICLTDPPWGIAYSSTHNSARSGLGKDYCRLDGNFLPICGDQETFDPSPLLRFSRVVLWGGHCFYDRLPKGGTWIIWDKLDGKAPFHSGSDCEMAWCNWKGPTRLFTHLWRGIMRDGEENIVHSRKLHPNQKPLSLMRWSIEQAGPGSVIDPYMGSGSAIRAAKDLNRMAIGIEIEERYCEIAAKRMEQRVFDFEGMTA
jgi:site-specific DNA-methyltransferase (adenine-specific)/modification methylase